MRLPFFHRSIPAPQDLDLSQVQARDPGAYPALLESVAAHPQSGRWDLLFAEPGETLHSMQGRLGGSALRPEDRDFFAALDRCAATEACETDQRRLPFIGGWFLYLGYEAAALVEPGLTLPPSPHGLPDALAVRCRAAILHDRAEHRLHLISETGVAMLDRLAAAVAAPAAHPPTPWQVAQAEESPAAAFVEGVARIHEWLLAGDVFQVNLSRAWSATLAADVDPARIYRRLRRANPAPFAGLMRWGDRAVLSSSPERLIQIDADCVQTRPIAGTCRRGADADEDALLRARLIASVKERAEHVMLIDLERNDLGRVCEPGSIEVSELMTLETYAHVHHIVSNVRGRLRPGIGPGAALRAVFPGGTITGCPKVRAMEIIAALEGEGRGPYTGTMGYLSRDGRLDSNILIRSLVWAPGRLHWRTGAGIVADSQAQAELEETRSKARGLLLALGDTA